MPCDYSKYPDNWKTEIVPRILERAGHKCENCGLKNGQSVWSVQVYVKTLFGKYGYRSIWFSKRNDANRLQNIGSTPKKVKVILTVAHLDHDEDNPDVQDDRLRRQILPADVGHLRRDVQRDRGHAIAITVQKIAGMDCETANVDGNVYRWNVAIAMCTDRAVREGGKSQRVYLVQVTSRPARYESGRPERLVGRAHYFPKRRGYARIIEILKHDNGRRRNLRERGHLLLQACVSVPPGRCGGSKRRCGGISDHRRELREARPTAPVHVPDIPRSDVEQLNHVADRRCVVFSQSFE